MVSTTARGSRLAGEGWGVRTWLGVAIPDHRTLAVVRRHIDVYREFLFLNAMLAVGEPTLAFLMGLLFSALVIVYLGYARTIHHLMYYFTIVINPIFWFSGAFFPLDQLPGWAQTVGWFNPLTHVVDIFRGLAAGDLTWALGGDVLWLAVVTPPVCWLAIWSLRRRLIR